MGLYGDLPIADRRLLFVKKRMMERGGNDFAKGDEMVRKLAPVAITAVADFDRNEYVDGYVKWVMSDEADATQVAIAMRYYSFGCERIQEWCDNHHERPKTCECAQIQDVLMGFKKTHEELPE